MTELEKQLLTAFEALQSAYEKQHQEWLDASNALQAMFEHTSRENRNLRTQISSLSEQVNSLSEQVSSLSERLR